MCSDSIVIVCCHVGPPVRIANTEDILVTSNDIFVFCFPILNMGSRPRLGYVIPLIHLVTPHLARVIAEFLGSRCCICEEGTAVGVKWEARWLFFCVQCVLKQLPDVTTRNIHARPGSINANHSKAMASWSNVLDTPVIEEEHSDRGLGTPSSETWSQSRDSEIIVILD